jgi:hypothetical protein
LLYFGRLMQLCLAWLAERLCFHSPAHGTWSRGVGSGEQEPVTVRRLTAPACLVRGICGLLALCPLPLHPVGLLSVLQRAATVTVAMAAKLTQPQTAGGVAPPAQLALETVVQLQVRLSAPRVRCAGSGPTSGWSVLADSDAGPGRAVLLVVLPRTSTAASTALAFYNRAVAVLAGAGPSGLA